MSCTGRYVLPLAAGGCRWQQELRAKAAVPVGRRLLTALEGNGACQQLCFLRTLLWALQVLFTTLLPYFE